MALVLVSGILLVVEATVPEAAEKLVSGAKMGRRASPQQFNADGLSVRRQWLHWHHGSDVEVANRRQVQGFRWAEGLQLASR